MNDQQYLLTTTPATVKAYSVECMRDSDDGSLIHHYEPVIAWLHEISPTNLITDGRSCFPITALEGVMASDYAIYFPENDYWQIHSGSPDLPGSVSSTGKTKLEIQLAANLEADEA